MSDESAGENDARTPIERFPDDPPRHTPLWSLLSRWLLALEAWLRSRGGTKLRGSLRVFWGLVAAVGAFLLFGPVINPPLTLDDITSSASDATETWIAREFDADYTITRDAEGRLQADVVESITAFFPDDVDESGIERTLATQYEGHGLEPSGITAEIDGVDVNPELDESPDRLTLTLDTGERLRGDHEVVLRYTLSDLAYVTTDEASGESVDLLEWSVFGPSWPQAFTGLDVTITLPDDLAEHLVRQPHGSIAWTLVSGGDWLEPEDDSPSGFTTYAFTNDQNIPPHAQAWFTLLFEPGTFAMPGPTPLFLLQTFGPLLPLAFLIVTLLFSLAARAVAWSDERGKPWFVAQYEPPHDVSPATAAQLLEVARTRELAILLQRWQEARGATDRRDRLIALGRAARRTGRFGDLVRAASAYRIDPVRRRQVSDGYRRIPRGFVRDAFLLSPLALSLVQIGLVRQLSHQTTLAIVWWPGLFVAASLVLGAIIVAIALSARPLTRAGALTVQHLRGIEVYARRTHLLARATLDDPVLPYAVLQHPARDAGRRVVDLVTTELGDDGALRQWRTAGFLSGIQLLVRVTAVILVVAAIAFVAAAPNPYARSSVVEDWDFASPATLYTQVESVDISATLARRDTGLRLEVTQSAEVVFEEGAPRVPQFAQRWPTRIDGQDLGFSVRDVRVDDEDVEFDVARIGDRAEVTTRLSDVLTGTHTVEVDYVLDDAATAGVGSPLSDASGGPVDRVRWAALLDGWESGWTYPSAPRVSLALTLPDDLAASTTASGWLRQDPDTADHAKDWRDSAFPFGSAVRELGAPDYLDEADRDDYGEIQETTERAAATTTHALRTAEGEYGYPTHGTYTDLGVLLEFPAGTFDTDATALAGVQAYRGVPIAIVWTTAGAAALIALAGLLRAGARSRRTPPGAFRDVVWMLGPAAALASVIVFVWASGDMPADWPEFTPLILGASLALVSAIVGYVAIRPLKTAR